MNQTLRRMPVVKAAAVEWAAVYDKAGVLVGVCDRAEITPVAEPDDGMQSVVKGSEAVPLTALKKALYGDANAVEQARAVDALNTAAAVALRRIRADGPR